MNFSLIWSTVDFKNETITIRHTVVRVCTDISRDDKVKREARFCTLPLPQSLLVTLQALHKHQSYMQSLFGRSYSGNDYICKRDDGSSITPVYLTKRFGTLLKQKGLRHIHFHDLRHSAASLLITNGHSLEEVQAFLGHASRKSTEIYAHFQCGTKVEMANTMESLLA